MKALGQNRKKHSFFKISEAEFGLIKVLFYSSKSQNFYGIILRSHWFSKGKLNHSASIVSIKMFSTNLDCS